MIHALLAVLMMASSDPSPEALDAARKADTTVRGGDAKGSLPLYQKSWDLGLRSADVAVDAACAASRVGDHPLAFTWLDRAVSAGTMDLKELKTDPDLEPLRKDKRFESILAGAEKNRLALKDPALRDELLRRVDEDQAARNAWMAGGPHGPASLGERVKAADISDTAWLKDVIAHKGWPGKSMVGVDGAQDAWLLAQHADLDPAFQAQVLKLLEPARAKGEVTAQQLAYLTDRVRVAQGKSQLYGTQFGLGPGGQMTLRPVEDEAHLDDRRRAIGLEPLAAYRQHMAQMLATTRASDAGQ